MGEWEINSVVTKLQGKPACRSRGQTFKKMAVLPTEVAAATDEGSAGSFWVCFLLVSGQAVNMNLAGFTVLAPSAASSNGGDSIYARP
jgi:hypothetical protein